MGRNQNDAGKMQQHLQSLQQFLTSSNPLLMVSGEVGSGKTILLDQFVSQIRITKQVLRIRGQAKFQPANLIRLLSKHWATKGFRKTAKLETQLQQMLDGLSHHDQHCILVVDDAHLLPFSVLAALSHLAVIQSENVHLHVVLSGRRGLISKMQSLVTREIPTIELKQGEITADSQHQRDESDERIDILPAAAIKTRAVIDASGNFWQQHGVRLAALCALALITLAFTWARHHPNTLPFHTAKKKPSRFDHLYQPRPQLALNDLIHSASINNVPLEIDHNKTTKATYINYPSTSYTLQIMANRNPAVLQQFAAHVDLKDAHTIFTVDHGKPWYILTVGNYPNSQKATLALHHLPHSLHPYHPWVRPLKTVHLLA